MRQATEDRAQDAGASTEQEPPRQRLVRHAMVGRITSAIAHEMSQPLGAIHHNVEAGLLFLTHGSHDQAEFRQILEDIRGETRRVCALVHRVRELARHHESRRDTFDLDEVVGNVVELLRVESGRRRTRLECRCAELPMVLGDPIRLQQLLLNLVLDRMDALDAVPESRRRIHIRTGRIDAAHVRVEVVADGVGATLALDVDPGKSLAPRLPVHRIGALGQQRP